MSLYYPLFHLVPDFSEPVAMGLSTLHDRLTLAASAGFVAFPQQQTDRFFSHLFTGVTKGEIVQVKEFFRERGGRTHPFYLPSWRNDVDVQGTVAAGVNQIVIPLVGDGYAAEHLDDTPEDHFGRQLYFWMPGSGVTGERILRTIPVDDDFEILELVEPLPFEYDPSKGLCGWAYLARFMEENLTWSHPSPDVATTTLRFRCIRGWNGITQENFVGGADQYGSNKFTSLRQVQQLTEPITNRVAYAPGPFNLRYVQEEPYSQQWAAYPGEFRVMLYQGDDEIWLPAAVGAPSVLFSGTVVTDHITLAFDQNSSEVIAYQKADGVTIEVRQLFNGELEVVTFEGQDPLLIFNYLVDGDLETGDTDVVLYYMKPGRNLLYWRFQRENFGTERICCQLAGKPIALKRTWVDADAELHKLEYLDAGFRSATLSSPALPPIPPPITHHLRIFSEAMDSLALSVGGNYLPVEVPVDYSPEAMAGMTLELWGSYDSLLVFRDIGNEAMSGLSLSLTGAYTSAIVPGPDNAEYMTNLALVLSGAHDEVIVAPDPNHEYATAGPLTITGVYEPA
jgi:hypothetical protein